MRHSRCNQHGVAGDYLKLLITQLHQARAVRDVINLFGALVTMQRGARSGGYRGLGEALVAVAMNGRVHQFADSGAIFGDVSGDVGSRCFHGEVKSRRW